MAASPTVDLALARPKEAGLRERTTQRTDSTHVNAAARDPTRRELITEAVRAALEEVTRTAGHLSVGPVDEEWGRRYGRLRSAWATTPPGPRPGPSCRTLTSAGNLLVRR